MNKILYPEFNVDYITNVMSLRKPQKQSIKILDSILDDIELSKSIDLKKHKIIFMMFINFLVILSILLCH